MLVWRRTGPFSALCAVNIECHSAVLHGSVILTICHVEGTLPSVPGPIAQRQSARLITGWLEVRILLGPLFLRCTVLVSSERYLLPVSTTHSGSDLPYITDWEFEGNGGMRGCVWSDLNARHPVPKTGALSAELQTRMTNLVYHGPAPMVKTNSSNPACKAACIAVSSPRHLKLDYPPRLVFIPKIPAYQLSDCRATCFLTYCATHPDSKPGEWCSATID